MSKRLSARERVKRLELSAEKTARALCADPTLEVYATGVDAFYDWRNHKLHVPAYSLQEDASEEVIMAFRGLLDHECAHVEYSDCELIDEQLDVWTRRHGRKDARKMMTLTNCFEDPWIERHWAIKNPGSAKFLEAKTEYVIRETGGAAICDPDYLPPAHPTTGNGREAIGMFTAFTQAIVRVGSGYVKLEQCAPSVQKLMRYCRQEIEAGWAVDSTAEAITAAEAVWSKLHQLAEEERKKREEEQQAKAAAKGESGDGEETGAGGEGEGEGDNSQPGEGEGEGEESSGGGEAGEQSEETDDGSQSGGQIIGGVGYDGGGIKEVEENIDNAATSAVDDDEGELQSAGEVIAGENLSDPSLRPYTVHPKALADDQWVEYSPKQRKDAREKLDQMRMASGRSVTRLANYLRTAVKSMQESQWVGGLDDGDDIDPAAMPLIALNSPDPNVFMRRFQRLDENTFVCVLVDLSGSMRDNKPVRVCPVHGITKARKADRCQHKDRYTGEVCNQSLQWVSPTKAGKAAITALALHESLRLCSVHHCVLGYRTNYGGIREWTMREEGDNSYYSRFSSRVDTNVFVPAPGLADDGSALPYITGGGANADGESLMYAAKYAAKHSLDHDRVIMLVISDGLPAGADDEKIEDRHLRDCVQRIARAGIEVYGIGVGIRERKTFASFYPNEGSVGTKAATGHVLLDNQTGLSDTVLKQLAALMTKSTGFARNAKQKRAAGLRR